MCVVAYLIILDSLQKNIRYVLSGNNIYFSGVTSLFSMNFISQLLSNYFGIKKCLSPALFTFRKISGKMYAYKNSRYKINSTFSLPFLWSRVILSFSKIILIVSIYSCVHFESNMNLFWFNFDFKRVVVSDSVIILSYKQSLNFLFVRRTYFN
jgi:hypothetical protein